MMVRDSRLQRYPLWRRALLLATLVSTGLFQPLPTLVWAAHGDTAAAVSAPSTETHYSTQDMPPALRQWAFYEQKVNRRVSSFLKSDPTYPNLPPQYDPINQPVFDIGYIEIPVDEAKADVTTLSSTAQKALITHHDGKTYYRYFIHPMMEETHAKAIQKYGIHRGEFLASPSSSPRSLWVWSKSDPSIVVGQKVSLGVEISGLVRLNPTDKLNRAISSTRFLSSIPKSVQDQYHFTFLPEPMTLEAPDKAYGTITRDFPEGMAYPNGNPKFLAGTSLMSPRPNREPPIFIQLMKESGQAPADFIENKILRPMTEAYGYLMFEEGYSTEPHSQNLLFELDEHGKLTGRVIFRDLDSFKADIEFRDVRGKTTEPYRWLQRPYKTLKLNKATDYYDKSYFYYLRGDWGARLEDMVNENSSALHFGAGKKIAIWSTFDRLFLTEAVRHLGSDAVLGDRLKEFAGRNRDRLEKLYPHVDWDHPKLTAEETDQLLKTFGVEAVMGGKSEIGHVPFKIADFIDRFETTEYNKYKPSSISQDVLREEFARLQFNYRASTKVAPPKAAEYFLRNGSIEAFRPNGALYGIALLEPESMLDSDKPFYAGSKYPRQEPDRALLKTLIAEGKKENTSFVPVNERVTEAPVADLEAVTPPKKTMKSCLIRILEKWSFTGQK